ncbi:PBP1A family penicillin-binding protein [Candidatus Roizmanbacteria bacterium]|nr:PBP1A family penicillin-binding protein [Candidatus Roizmanbacteria bacterium]
MNQLLTGPMKSLRPLLRGVFFLLYLFVNFFILVGEGTRFCIAILVMAPILLIKKLKRFRPRPRLSFVPIHLSTFPRLRFPRLPHVPFKYCYLPVQSLVRGLYRFLYSIIAVPIHIFCAVVSPQFRFFLLGFIVCIVVVGIFQAYQFVRDLPSPKSIGKVNYALSTHLYDRHGTLLYEMYDDQNRTPIQLSQLPSYVGKATVAIEDKDFYRHNGVSWYSGVLRALWETVVSKNVQGGSTITQQLVKSALLTPERTVQRKVKEFILALWTERLYAKDKILEMYLNQVSYGGSAYGIEEAAKSYFGIPAKQLSLAEAAFLAGLPQAPSLYSPYINPELAKQRKNDVLKKMAEQGYISLPEKQKAEQEDIQIKPIQTVIHAPHFVFYTKAVLEDQYGSNLVEQGGLSITTTLDLPLQQKAEQILREELEKIKNLNVTNGAILVTKPKTGEILAMVGSVDYFAAPSGAYNVTTALRQPGSSIKPLMYSLALDRGYTAASLIDDSPVSFPNPWGPAYTPLNYDGRYHGKVPLRMALANSYNIPAVKVLNAVGVDSFVEQAKRLGITTWTDQSRFGLSLTLGGGEVHMTDMAEAYGTFANAGNKATLSPVKGIYKIDGSTLYAFQPEQKKVLNEGVAFIISHILADNFARQNAFGAHSSLEIPGYTISVKTGTTNDKKDNWTIGYNGDYLVAVWVGNNDNTPMNPSLTSGITGAAPIWNRVMSYLVTNTTASTPWLNKPDNVVAKDCYFGRKEYFIKGTETNVNCMFATPSATLVPTH